MDDQLAGLRAIHDVLVQRGFERDWSAEKGVAYRGRLDPSNLNLPAIIELTDFDFLGPIRIRLLDLDGRRVPHVQRRDGSICYFEQGAVVFDRYDPAGTVLQCLERAETVVRDAVRGRLDADFAEEFEAYWGSGVVLVEDAVALDQIRMVPLSRSGSPMPVLCGSESWLLSARGGALPASQPCSRVEVAGALSVPAAGAWPVTTLAELNEWLALAVPGAVGRLEAAFAATGKPVQWLALMATNGTFFARAELPSQFRTPEFLKSRREQMPALLGRIAASVPIQRWNGQRADSAFLFGRNLAADPGLFGKRILLIGCGTIGGFLAQQLAQAGAGGAGGRLLLADRDVLSTGNLGRHLLGAPYLFRNKAEGCRDFVREQLPMLDVHAFAGDGLDVGVSWTRFDLVIDATGEEGFSLALNHRLARMQSPPPVLFAWLVGNGAAAQCLLSTGEGACLKCLKPELAGPPRFRTLRPDKEVLWSRMHGCADAGYLPFPVSRSVAAASMACEQVLAWSEGKVRHAFRSITLDSDLAFQVKDANPMKTAACPACGEAA